MPVVSRFYGILIKMYFGDHVPPHFHAEYNEFSAQIAIDDYAVVKGWLPPKALGLVMEWACLHKSELLENWESLNKPDNGSFKKIEPLK